MNIEEAYYILNYFPRLMTLDEIKARSHHMGIIKIGNPEEYDSLDKFERRKQFYLKRDLITENEHILELLDKGYDEFILKTARRIAKDTPNEYTINRCPKCDFITRTPYAKQCRKCSHNWHYKIKGEFEFVRTLKISKYPFFWIVGRLIKGEIQKGYVLDLTNFQLNIKAEIKRVEYCLMEINGKKEDLPSLGINLSESEEKLVKQYLTVSAKTIMIIE